MACSSVRACGPVVGQEHAGRQMLRVRIDGVAEEDELHQRHADHHQEGQPVPAHLDEFLHHDRPEPAGRELAVLPHDKPPSGDWLHEVNEYVFQAGIDVTPFVRLWCETERWLVRGPSRRRR